jgi:hypothetical protein
MEQVADLPQNNGDLPQEFCVAQGLDNQVPGKQLRLTPQGVRKLEDALKNHFGDIPDHSKVAREFLGNVKLRETVAKVRDAREAVVQNSIERLFTALNLDLEPDDCESLVIKHLDRIPQVVAPNPFWQTLPIGAPEAFIGREFWFNELIKLLDKGCSCNVIGPERMGRSSILKQVCAVGPKALKKTPIDSCIYLNLRNIDNSQDFFGALCHELEIIGAQSSHDLKRSLKGRKHLLCLDDIEQLADGNRFDQSERRKLRGLAEAGHLILLIASKQHLWKTFSDSSLDDSPLDGICTGNMIPPFSQKDVERWVDYHLTQTGISFSPQQLNQLRENSKGVPGLLQQLARDLYDRVASGADQV